MKRKSQNPVTTSIDINQPDNPLLVLRNGNTLKFLISASRNLLFHESSSF